MSIGNNIKKRRLELNMSQGELAKKCGFTYPAAISKIEKGQRDVNSSKLELIADALGVSPVDLILDKEDIDKVGTPHVLALDKGNVSTLSVAFVEVLERLGGMYKDGLLSPEEFQAAKDRILRENLI